MANRSIEEDSHTMFISCKRELPMITAITSLSTESQRSDCIAATNIIIMNNIIVNIINIINNNIMLAYWSWLRLLAGGFVEDLVGGGRRPDVAETMWKNLQARIGSKLEHHI